MLLKLYNVFCVVLLLCEWLGLFMKFKSYKNSLFLSNHDFNSTKFPFADLNMLLSEGYTPDVLNVHIW